MHFSVELSSLLVHYGTQFSEVISRLWIAVCSGRFKSFCVFKSLTWKHFLSDKKTYLLGKPATKSDSLSWVPRTRVEGENLLLQVVLYPPFSHRGMCWFPLPLPLSMCVLSHIHTNTSTCVFPLTYTHSENISAYKNNRAVEIARLTCLACKHEAWV